MRLGAQDPDACEQIGAAGALASLADMLHSDDDGCRCALLHKMVKYWCAFR